MRTKLEIRKKEKELRSMVARYVKSQLPYWKQVPYWALLADRDNPTESICFIAYGLKRYHITPSLCVDLTRGLLMGSGGNKPSGADILLASRETEKLDARNLIAKFKIMAKRPLRSWMDEVFLEEMLEKHNIEKPQR